MISHHYPIICNSCPSESTSESPMEAYENMTGKFMYGDKCISGVMIANRNTEKICSKQFISNQFPQTCGMCKLPTASPVAFECKDTIGNKFDIGTKVIRMCQWEEKNLSSMS